MNGKRVLLDTNAIIALLQNNQKVIEHTNGNWVGASVISEIEFLSFPGLSAKDRELFAKFAAQAEIIDLAADDQNLMATIIQFRRNYKIKLPDAIVAATAWIYFDRTIVTTDHRYASVSGLEVLSF